MHPHISGPASARARARVPVCIAACLHRFLRTLPISLEGGPIIAAWCRVTAQALFSAEPILPQRCEAGRPPCRALLQVGSYSFAAVDRALRFRQLRDAIAAHVRRHPEALIVLEEFDRFDCGLRDMLREVRCAIASAAAQHPVASWFCTVYGFACCLALPVGCRNCAGMT